MPSPSLCVRIVAILLSSLSTAAVAGEITVDGKPCNDFCQSWLGMKSAPVAAPAPVAAATPVDIRPALPPRAPSARPESTLARASAAEPSRVAEAPSPAVEDRTPAIEAPAPVAEAPRLAGQAPTPAVMPPAPVIARPLRRQPSARMARVEDLPTQAPTPGPATPDRSAPAPADTPASSRTPLALHEASAPTPALPSADPASEADPATEPAAPTPGRPKPRPTWADHIAMPPGPITLPRMSDIVAQRGVVMLETPQERAVRLRQHADLEKGLMRAANTGSAASAALGAALAAPPPR